MKSALSLIVMVFLVDHFNNSTDFAIVCCTVSFICYSFCCSVYNVLKKRNTHQKLFAIDKNNNLVTKKPVFKAELESTSKTSKYDLSKLNILLIKNGKTSSYVILNKVCNDFLEFSCIEKNKEEILKLIESNTELMLSNGQEIIGRLMISEIYN